jgi:hypothetical protein
MQFPYLRAMRVCESAGSFGAATFVFLVPFLLELVVCTFRRAIGFFTGPRRDGRGSRLTGGQSRLAIGRGENANSAFLACAHQGREFFCDVRADFEACFRVVDPDRADVFLGDLTLAADFRQQPFGVGFALAPDRNLEPHAAHHLVARWFSFFARTFFPCAVHTRTIITRAFPTRTLGVRRPFLRSWATMILRDIRDVFRRRQLRAIELHEGRRDIAWGGLG